DLSRVLSSLRPELSTHDRTGGGRQVLDLGGGGGLGPQQHGSEGGDAVAEFCIETAQRERGVLGSGHHLGRRARSQGCDLRHESRLVALRARIPICTYSESR